MQHKEDRWKIRGGEVGMGGHTYDDLGLDDL